MHSGSWWTMTAAPRNPTPVTRGLHAPRTPSRIGSMKRTVGIVFAWMACLAPLAGCVVYDPYYAPVAVPGPTPAQTYDRAWNAALDALKDSGVRVTSANPNTGVIRGASNQSDVDVTVLRQADGTIKVEIEATSTQGRDTGLASRISEAYKRRMGV